MKSRCFAPLVALIMIVTACGKSETPPTPSSTPAVQNAPIKVATPVVNAEAAAVLGQLSYCGAIAVAQSIWNRQNGYSDVAGTLEVVAYAYGKTAVEYGQNKGYSEADVIALNRKNNDKVMDEIKNGFFFDGPSLHNKNENCLDLVKYTTGLAEIWRRQFN